MRHRTATAIDRKTILVVDDDAATRRAYATLLEECGYRTMEACNGGEAIWLVRRHAPDAILMDIMMPVVSGVEAAESLREHPLTADIPIVGVTGSARQVERERMTGLCDALLLKPCPPDQILGCVRELTTLRRADARRA